MTPEQIQTLKQYNFSDAEIELVKNVVVKEHSKLIPLKYEDLEPEQIEYYEKADKLIPKNHLKFNVGYIEIEGYENGFIGFDFPEDFTESQIEQSKTQIATLITDLKKQGFTGSEITDYLKNTNNQ